jgi:energy-coupling factor transporter transmembrane protein EcfT
VHDSGPAAVAATAGPSGVPDFVQRPPEGTYRRLNPTTKLVIATVEALIAFVLRGWTGLVIVLALVFATALIARIGRAMLPFVLATIPLIASILLVNTFLYPGATDVIVRIGPLAPSWTGLEFASWRSPSRSRCSGSRPAPTISSPTWSAAASAAVSAS